MAPVSKRTRNKKKKSDTKSKTKNNTNETKTANVSRALLPLENPLILNHVLQYLNVESLKRSRLVNSMWKEEVTAWLKKKSKVRVKVSSAISDDSEKAIHVSMYNQKMRGFPVENLKVPWIIYSMEMDMVAVRADAASLLRLFDDWGSNFRYLEMRFMERAFCEADPNFYQKILRKVKAVNHMKLDIHFVEKAISKWSDLVITEEEIQNSVTRLELKVFLSTDKGNEWWTVPQGSQVVAQKLALLFPNLTEIVIERAPNEFLIQMFNRFGSRTSIRRLSLPKRGFHSNTIQKISMKSFMVNLSCLRLHLSLKAEQKELEEMFKRYAPTLVELSLTIGNALKFSREFVDADESPVKVALPIFPKLKKLAILISDPDLEDFNDNDDEDLEIIFYLQFKFVTFYIDYDIQFPMLQKLTFTETHWIGGYFISTFYAEFIPYCNDAEHKKVVARIVELDFPFLDFEDPYCMSVLKALVNSFPNAYINVMDKQEGLEKLENFWRAVGSLIFQFLDS